MTLKLMGKKLGMTKTYDKIGNLIPCTVLEVQPNVITQVKDEARDGYVAVQLAGCKLRSSRKKNMKKPQAGFYEKAKIEPREFMCESRVEETSDFEVGKEIHLEQFAEGSRVDVTGRSKGKGFQGVMKRHNFKGGPAAHGSGFHRTPGSTGQCSDPGRNFPGGKKSGHMGDERTTVQGLEVVKVDAEKNLLLVKGPVPGARNKLVYIQKSIKSKG